MWSHGLRAVALVLAVARAAAAQCGGTQLCAAGSDPCVVTSGCTVAAGALLDLRPRALIVAAGVTVSVTGEATTEVRAQSILLESGARLVAEATTGLFGSGGTLRLLADAAVTQRSGAVIDVTGRYLGGHVTIEGTDVVLEGHVDASANADDGLGGTVTIAAGEGRVLIAGNGVHANGGPRGDLGAFGGTVQVAAATHVVVDGPVRASRGDCAFCAIELYAEEGSVVTTTRGALDVRGSGGSGEGGEITIVAGASVELAGTVIGTAAGSEAEGGAEGGALSVTAENGHAVVAGAVDLGGASPDGDGGFVSVDAGLDARLLAPVLVRTDGQGAGGTVMLSAGRDASLEAVVDARGGSFDGGSIDVVASGDAAVLRMASLMADGRNGGAGGQIAVTACHLEVQGGSTLSALGPGGAPLAGARMTAYSGMTIGGTVRSGETGGSNVFTTRTTPPQILPSANVVPVATLRTDAGLPCCEGCPTTTTSTTSTTTSTTVTTTSTTTSTTVTTTSTTTSTTATTTSTSTSMTATTSSSTASSTTSTTSSSTSTSTVSTSTSSSVSSTTSSTSTTTTSPASTSTTTSTTSPTVPTPTTTLPPGPCDETPAGIWTALSCRLTLLRAAVDAQDTDALGGAKTAKAIRRSLARAAKQVALAENATRPSLPLRRASAALRGVTSTVARAERSGRIDGDLARRLRELGAEASSAADALRQGMRSASTVSIDQASQAAANRTNPTSRSV